MRRKVLVGVFLFTALAAAAEDAPQWMRDVAGQTVATFPAKVQSVVLLHEEQVTVDADGRRTMRERGAIRILQRGRGSVTASRYYNTKSGKIREFQGWLIPPSGKAVTYGKSQVLDVPISKDYDEGRAKMLEAGADAQPGSVFGYEIVEDEKTIFTDTEHWFQESEPVVLSRFILSVPQGWQVKGTLHNWTQFEPAVAGGTYTWEMRDLPWREHEPHSPGLHSIVPRIGVNYFPATENKAGLRPLKNWQSVSGWLSGFVEPATETTSAIREKAVELTRGAKTELEKIRLIAAFAQQTMYVSVQMNLMRGGGYTPHNADQVLSRNYGDCKDKSTLMRALLRPLGIDSYLTVIYSGDRRYVSRDWPSPRVFNHAIIAIRVSDSIMLPTVLEHPQLGRLLLFDPTDSDTPVGDLPEDEQGSHALVIAGEKGELVTVPLLPAAANRIEASVNAELALEGNLTAHVLSNYFGQDASFLRSFTRRSHPDEVKKMFEVGLSRRLGGLTLKEIVPADHVEEGRLQINMEFDVRQFGQLMQGRLLVVRPGALLPGNDYGFAAKERKSPIRLFAKMRKDSVAIQLPAGFKIDELPDPVSLKSPYGTYAASWKATGDQISFQQSIELTDTLAPASDYAKVRDFFEKLWTSQQAPVVLLKQ
jgi:transglutaminase-like putative cysteine protease